LLFPAKSLPFAYLISQNSWREPSERKVNMNFLSKAKVSIAVIALVSSTGLVSTSASAAGLPSIRITTAQFSSANGVDATGDIAQYYSAGTKAYYTYVAAGSTISITYRVTTDGMTAAANQKITMEFNAPYSGSKAKWTVGTTPVGPAGDGYSGLAVEGTTDAKGNVTFTFKNTDTTGVEDAIDDLMQDRGATTIGGAAGRLYGTFKPSLPGKGDKDTDIDLLTIDVAESTPEFGIGQNVAEISATLKTFKLTKLPAKSEEGIRIVWASSTPAVCSTFGVNLITKKVGDCKITGTNAGSDTVMALAFSQTIKVSK
jgi:hypothetical protein